MPRPKSYSYPVSQSSIESIDDDSDDGLTQADPWAAAAAAVARPRDGASSSTRRGRPQARRASSASDPVKRPRRSCTESSWGEPDYACAAYDDRVDAAVRAGAVLFPKRSW